jgi:uncharacterized protein YraI
MNAARSLAALLAILLLAMGTTLAGEAGTALKAADLKAEPFRDAQTVGSLTAGDKVEILKKQGGWFQVKSATGRGWVRMLSIRRGEARKASGDAAGVLGLASGRAGTGNVVATTGIRGLNEEELKAAKFNETELRKVESFAVKEAEARRFAAEGKLATRKVEYLSTPEAVKGERE